MIDINCGMVIGAIVIVGIIGISVANYTQRKSDKMQKEDEEDE